MMQLEISSTEGTFLGFTETAIYYDNASYHSQDFRHLVPFFAETIS